MTFNEIVADVMDRLNLTSADATTRIGRFVNHRYRWITSEVGLSTLSPAGATALTTIGSRFVSFIGLEKLYVVYDPATTPARILEERTIDQMAHMPSGSDPAQCYAIYQTGANTVTVQLDTVAGSAYVLGANGDSDVPNLSGTNTPAFSEKFHDLLVYGAMAEELDKMEKYDLAKKQEAMFTIRMGQFRYYLAKTAYKAIYQGRNGDSPRRPGIILSS
jgi:hypothetical protein